MINGWGSRDKYKTVTRRMPLAPKEDSSMALSAGQSDEEVTDTDAKPIAASSDSQQVSAPKRSIVRLDNLIMEAISSLKDPGGSDKTTIAAYIESSFEQELERVRNSASNLQNRLRVGLEIENHLKRRVSELEKNTIRTAGILKKEVAELHHYHSQQS